MAYVAFIVMALIVYLITKKGDADWIAQEHTKPPAPEWARWLYIITISGGVMLCLFLCGLAASVGGGLD